MYYSKELEKDPNTDETRRRSDREQHGEPYQPCIVVKDEFPPMGWSQEGAGTLSKIRSYWKNEGKMEELIRKKEKKKEEWKIYRNATSKSKQ